MNRGQSLPHNEGLSSVIHEILKGLALCGIKCAVRRNVNNISVPYVSDVDILVGGKHLDSIIDVITAHAEIIRMKLSYGVLKVWIRTPDGLMKELDFLWRASRWGVILLDTEDLAEILDNQTVMNGDTPVLSPEGMGRLIYAEKTKKADFAKYSFELRKAGITNINKRSHVLFLLRNACQAPLKTMKSSIRFISLRMSRLLHPVGVAIYCQVPIKDSDDVVLQYLFDRRFYRPKTSLGRLFYRNIMGGLVWVDDKNDADIVIDDGELDIVGQIIDYHRKNRGKLSRLQVSLA